MTLRERAAAVLDASTYADVRNYGIYTRSARWTLACWLDGQPIRGTYVRKLIKYLRSIVAHVR